MTVRESRGAPRRVRASHIDMAHGAGGKTSRRLIDELFAATLLGSSAAPLGDSAWVTVGDTPVAMTADSYVVRPLRFPGGSIGELAVNGTVNDLAVAGAEAVALVVTYVIEAGLPSDVLEAEVDAMARAARLAGVAIVGGDTKVVEHGKADGMYLSTMGIGRRLPGVTVDARRVRPGDQVIASGYLADHGITILLARGELELEADLRSDTRSVFPLVKALADAAGPGIRWMRDPTRGGAATALNELASDSGLSVQLVEETLPVREVVRGACELLGLEPLHIASEGQFLAVIAPDHTAAALDALHRTPGGADARRIGEIRETPRGSVLVTTGYGGSRIIDMLVGDPLPRIC
jgi:hydrogenase expression/formation protein HypE